MRYSVLIDNLQNLTNSKVDISEIAKVIGKPARTLYTRGQRDTEFKQSEINQIEEFYKVNLSKSDTSNNNSVTIDYYPDIFGSCGNGVFELSPEKTQIIVPKNAFFEKFSPNKQYSVINAHGNSMQPLIFDRDKLIVEHWNGEQIIDNKPYIFCYKDEIFIKRLAKNVDQLMIISENKDYDTRKLEGEQLKDVNIIGQIVGLMRDLR